MALFNTGSIAINNAAGTATGTQPALTTTASNALAANANRKRYLIFNPPTSTVTVFIAFSGTASATNGLPLAPGQGWAEEGYPIHTGVINAVCASNTATLIIWEWA